MSNGGGDIGGDSRGNSSQQHTTYTQIPSGENPPIVLYYYYYDAGIAITHQTKSFGTVQIFVIRTAWRAQFIC